MKAILCVILLCLAAGGCATVRSGNQPKVPVTPRPAGIRDAKEAHPRYHSVLRYGGNGTLRS